MYDTWNFHSCRWSRETLKPSLSFVMKIWLYLLIRRETVCCLTLSEISKILARVKFGFPCQHFAGCYVNELSKETHAIHCQAENRHGQSREVNIPIHEPQSKGWNNLYYFIHRQVGVIIYIYIYIYIYLWVYVFQFKSFSILFICMYIFLLNRTQ